MAANPNNFDYFREAEPISILASIVNPSNFDYFRITEPVLGFATGVSIKRLLLMGVG